eukprot:TRINITY_DN15593_c0_g1_i1.p1 TRINITY_DN15593_c0_g1~~TRINITY_DN15593_c0_g1_i1.p1  ORF type:complete len:454 (+),score=66.12 TRINITY_DN15593_c0_g1_i1:1-1362(+)
MSSQKAAPPTPGATLPLRKQGAELRAAQALEEARNKPKRVLILARYYFSLHEWVSSDYTRVVLADSGSRDLFDVTVRKKFNDFHFFDNYETNGNVELTAWELHKKYNFTHVIYISEQDIIRSARLRKAFGLSSGQSVSSALCFRDKIRMKNYINEHMTPRAKSILKIPKCRRVESALTIISFIEEHGLPVVVKPIAGMGSIQTYIIHNEESLQAMLREGISSYLDGPVDFEVEEFIQGQMYHIDGFVENGVVKIMWPSVYMNTCVSFKESKFLGSHNLEASNPLRYRLQECTEQVLASMDQPNSYSFHVELFHTPEDTFYLCEAACRTGGAGVSSVTKWLLGIDLNKATAEAQAGDKVSFPLPPSWKEMTEPTHVYGWIVVYPRFGTLESVPSSNCPYEQVLDCQVTSKRDFTEIEHCTDALASFLVKGRDEGEVREYIEKAVDWILLGCVWK